MGGVSPWEDLGEGGMGGDSWSAGGCARRRPERLGRTTRLGDKAACGAATGGHPLCPRSEWGRGGGGRCCGRAVSTQGLDRLGWFGNVEGRGARRGPHGLLLWRGVGAGRGRGRAGRRQEGRAQAGGQGLVKVETIGRCSWQVCGASVSRLGVPGTESNVMTTTRAPSQHWGCQVLLSHVGQRCNRPHRTRHSQTEGRSRQLHRISQNLERGNLPWEDPPEQTHQFCTPFPTQDDCCGTVFVI